MNKQKIRKLLGIESIPDQFLYKRVYQSLQHHIIKVQKNHLSEALSLDVHFNLYNHNLGLNVVCR